MMKKYWWLLLVVFVATDVIGQHKDQKAKDLVHTLVNAYIDSEYSPPGVSVAVMKNGDIVYAEGFGYSNIDTQEKVTVNTQFRAASVSKMMTVTGLAKLMQERQVSIDTLIQAYVPQFPEKSYPITPRLLAGHLAGIPHYSSEDKIEDRFYHSVGEALKVFSHIDLLYEPGANYSYSTHGYTLLSAVVEGVAGISYLDYMEKEIFQPLGMKLTGPHLKDSVMEHMTELYQIDQAGNVSTIADPEDPSYKWGAGGMVSTPSDLVRMGNAYLNGFIHPEIVGEMFQSQQLASGEETGVGIGWRGNWDIHGRRIFEHAGGMGGARSVISIFPEYEFAIAIMANAPQPWRIEETAHLLALPFLTDRSPEKQPRGKANITLTMEENDQPTTLQGELILNGSNDKLVFTDEDGKLQAWRLVYLQRDNFYGLITPFGIMVTTLVIHQKEKRIVGKTISYGSPQLMPPTFKNPFIMFEGHLVSE